MSTANSILTDKDNMPLLLGFSVIVIILIAFFSKGGSSSSKGKERALAAAVAPTTTSKKSKKKKAKAKAAVKKADKKVEDAPAPEADPQAEAPTTSKKKKKKKKKKGGGGTAAATQSSPTGVSETLAATDDDDSDDDLDFTLIQSAAKRKGANDATKRAAANKERERVRALKREEEKAKAAAKAKVEAEAAVKATAEAEALARKEQEDAAMQAALAAEAAAEEKKKSEAEEKKAEAEEKAKKNGASVNGGDNGAAPAEPGQKKKRKRKKKKGAAALALEESARPVLVKPAEVEHWETVPKAEAEEWQEVGHKKAKQKAKMEAAAEAAEDNPPFLLDGDSPVADEETGETSVTIPAGDDPLILIGKGGATIQHLQESTGAKFNLDRDNNTLTISGTEDCVQHGMAEAKSILAVEEERKANETEERVTWGSEAIKAVIGRGGSNIRATQDATGVRIDADVDAGTLVIVGPRDDVAAALTMCHNTAFGEVQDVLELGSRNAVNLIYGPGFQTIRSLQDETGCKLDIDRGKTSLKLAGSSEAVADATARVRALLEANRGFEMTIENSKVGAVYGKGGETLQSIQARTGTQIDVTRGPTHATVSVMGSAESAARARNMLQRAIDGEVELKPGEVAEEVELGPATAAVIGRGGSNVAELEKKHSVSINVRSELQKARVVGKPEFVAAAVKDIEAIAKPILEAEKAQKKADEAVKSGESAWQVNPEDDDDADGW